MQDSNAGAVANKTYNDVGKNAEAVLKLFNAYYRDHNHSGKLYDDFPNFFLFKPSVLEGK
jgi:hypothetical protein